MTKNSKFLVTGNGTLKVETHRAGSFIFQIGVDLLTIDSLLKHVEDAYARFYSMPLVGELAHEMEQWVMVSAIHGTNTIEGALLSPQETEQVMHMSAKQIQTEQQQRVQNLKHAYETMTKETFHDITLNMWKKIPGIAINTQEFDKALKQKQILQESLFKIIHTQVCEKLVTPANNTPGQYRNNNKAFPIKVGDEAHGGVYQPPKAHDDVILLMEALVVWANSEPILSLPILIRTPLIHYYFELIHPFQDGNGRVGRLVEAYLLQNANYKYVAKAMSTFYLKRIHQYFALFNQCRKAANQHEKNPNTAFVEFFLTTMLDAINHLHDRANKYISHFIAISHINSLTTSKQINQRQSLLLKELTENPSIRNKEKLANQAWYQALYKNLNDRTKARDFKKLIDLHFLLIQNNGDIIMTELEPKLKLSTHPATSLKNK